eukprot:CAMPEP_0201522198 /NCGR_PEP_ID=MMETSP0161_2-20130828/16513_1 /ASSEMBLY_ACC=CAM_ASM_000251 /TAXON_ID=180227 /ORGANISM="Neoparamoeba aestuarina, Strain SoJaBio B1-5/56/2" /LENGTH=194 /DNA_ID=CAMNT_0047920973 /DNA_START=94 /DNA_END=678 /DNA_ORIENTATION=+
MELFYTDVTEKAIKYIRKNHRADNYCKWKGVVCTDEVVEKIQYAHWRISGKFNIHALPPSVHEVSITYCMQDYAFNMRALPRTLRLCDLFQNLLYGSLDLRALPRTLISGNFSENLFTGPISLESLPPNLEVLKVEHTRILQHTVFYDSLPESVREIRVRIQKAGKIHDTRATRPTDATQNKDVFRGFPSKDVR